MLADKDGMFFFSIMLALRALAATEEASLFPACSDLLLVNERQLHSYEQEFGPIAHCQGLQIVSVNSRAISGIAGPIREAAFLAELENEVRTNLAVSAFGARRLEACARVDRAWFEGIQRTQDLESFCPNALAEIRSRVKEEFFEMRQNMALMAPRIREDQERPGMATSAKINVSAAHQFFGFASLPAMNQAEVEEALHRFDQDTALFRAEILRHRNSHAAQSNNNLSSGSDLARERMERVIRESEEVETWRSLRSYRENKRMFYRERYLQKLQAMPLLAFISHAEPSNEELISAIEKVRLSAESVLQRKGSDPKQFLSYEAAANRVLSRHPEFCGLAQAITKKFRRDRLVKDLSIGGGIAALNLGCLAIAGPIGSACALALGAPLSAAMLVKGGLEYRDSLREFTASIDGSNRIQSVADLSEHQRNLMISAALAPFNAGTAKLTRSSRIAAIRSSRVNGKAISELKVAEERVAQYAKRGVILTAQQEEEILLEELMNLGSSAVRGPSIPTGL